MNNEKILDIALAADPDIGRTLGDMNGKCWIAANGIRPQSVVKFTELIVRECLDQLSITDSSEDFDKGIAWSAQQIQEHFGVEE